MRSLGHHQLLGVPVCPPPLPPAPAKKTTDAFGDALVPGAGSAERPAPVSVNLDFPTVVTVCDVCRCRVPGRGARAGCPCRLPGPGCPPCRAARDPARAVSVAAQRVSTSTITNRADL